MTRDERLIRLEDRMAMLAEQTAEQNLRIRFLMEFFKVSGTSSGMLDANGQAIVQQMSLYEFYLLQGRENMMAMLDAQMEQADAQDETLGERIERTVTEDDCRKAKEAAFGSPLTFAARKDPGTH